MICNWYVNISGIVWDDPMLQKWNLCWSHWGWLWVELGYSDFVTIERLEKDFGWFWNLVVFFLKISLAAHCESHHPISSLNFSLETDTTHYWVPSELLFMLEWLGPAGHELGGGAFAEVRTPTIGGIGLQFTFCASCTGCQTSMCIICHVIYLWICDIQHYLALPLCYHCISQNCRLEQPQLFWGTGHHRLVQDS